MAAHRVNHLEIELAAGDVGLAEALIVRISQLHERRIAPTLDRVFSELSEPGRLDRIDRLELDLGSIPADDFDDEFVRRLEGAVRSALARALGERASDDLEAPLELLTLFARTGNLPWWSPRTDADTTGETNDTSDPVAAALTTLTRASPRALLDLLRELADDPQALARLARHCDGEHLASLVELRWPTAGAELSATTAWLARPESVPDASVLPTLHRGLLTALARPTVSDPATALRTLLSDLAVALGSSEPTLLARLAHAAARHDPPALLRGLLAPPELPPREPLAPARPEQSALPAPPAAAREDAPEDMPSSAFPSGHPETSSPDPDPTAPAPSTDPLALSPPDLRAAPRPSTTEPPDAPAATEPRAHSALAAPALGSRDDSPTAASAVARPDAHLPITPAAPALGSRDDSPAAASAVAPPDARPLDLRHPSIAPAELPPSDGSTSASLRDDATSPSAPRPRPRDIDAPRSTASPRRVPPPLPPDVLAARRRALEQLDQLYVDDGGLVILWPFLARFFERVGLLDEQRRFFDDPARMRAIALLEHLVLLNPEPPEYCLPLAKLLCGLAPDDSFALERPLEPELLLEGERLLSAVIDHAPVLRDISPDGLRAAFLRRPAALATRDGAWLLRVERRPHDVVLERFPWSWDWLKLPWMPDPLRVEW